MKITGYIIAPFLMSIGLITTAATTIDIDLSKKGADIAPTMYGLFFEDINYAADGGLYAEKIKNRSFEFPYAFTGWNISGNVELLDGGPFERNPHYVRLKASGHPHKHTAIENEGFFGISAEKGKEYRFTVWARATNRPSKIRVEIVNPASNTESQVIAKKGITVKTNEWKKYEAILIPNTTVEKGRLRIFLEHPDSEVDLEHLSLMPVETWKGRKNGLRLDLAQALADIHPGILRFPGGCIVEGTDLASRYQWKKYSWPS